MEQDTNPTSPSPVYFYDLTRTVASKIKNELYFGRKIFVMLIGHPLCGKDTFLKELKEYMPDQEFNILSFDDILTSLGEAENPPLTYNESFSKYSADAEKQLKRDFVAANENVVVVSNTTQLSLERRRINLSKFPDHHKLGIHFKPLEIDEFKRRNEIRKKTGKDIGVGILANLMKSYTEPTMEEGFDELIM